MNELEKGLELSLRGEEAVKAVEKALDHIRGWGLDVPDVEPLVLDFGTGDFQSTGEIEFWIANETEAGYCGKYLFVFEGQTCPEHMHKRKLETFFVVKGRLEVMYDGNRYDLGTGDVLRVEPGRPHRFSGVEPTLLLEVSMPSIIDDNFFSDPAIPIGGNHRPGTVKG